MLKHSVTQGFESDRGIYDRLVSYIGDCTVQRGRSSGAICGTTLGKELVTWYYKAIYRYIIFLESWQGTGTPYCEVNLGACRIALLSGAAMEPRTPGPKEV